MRCLLALWFAVMLAMTGHAQERRVKVQLENGETIQGTVLAMDLATLRVQVGDQVRTIDANRIRSCHFEAPEPERSLPSAADPVAPPAPAATAAPAAPRHPVARKRPLPDPVDPAAAEELPHDVRHRSLLHRRLDRLDEAYPWLHPTARVQWVSLGLLLAILMSLTVHASVKIAGGEDPSLGRSAGLALGYLVIGLIQFASLPCNDFTVMLMLLANPTLALLWLSGLFGLTRIGATIAFAVQLGFGVLAYGVLELVSAILASIGSPIA